MTKVEEIYGALLSMLAENGYEDNIENRYAALCGMRDGWKEDPEVSLEKSLYMIAINGEILILSMKIANGEK